MSYKIEQRYYIVGQPRYYGDIGFYKNKEVGIKELKGVLYKLYKDTGFDLDTTVSILKNRIGILVQVQAPTPKTFKVVFLDQDILYKLVSGSKYTYTKHSSKYYWLNWSHTRHSDYRYRNMHYIGACKMYSYLSTLVDVPYRGKNRDRGMLGLYSNLCWFEDESKHSAGWKNQKKRHQWE